MPGVYNTCDAVCAKEGQLCVENGCDGWTYRRYGSAGCGMLEELKSGSHAGCAESITWPEMGLRVRCCCAQD